MGCHEKVRFLSISLPCILQPTHKARKFKESSTFNLTSFAIQIKSESNPEIESNRLPLNKTNGDNLDNKG